MRKLKQNSKTVQIPKEQQDQEIDHTEKEIN